ncbi:rod shape-determining protein MreC [Pustulibacterium marinum]|uniref:Cell shape-determining protein MreC n=1 Tax=Pustulibacterium marinum TaxID=1224947 RepID=A0A1I7EV76_9FLAO|nr:rod shape-determining protein MreC [Pustulibacterium marinum]SFU27826.1 rod shape-determining protein MreC [Pustulibacterium marinum]
MQQIFQFFVKNKNFMVFLLLFLFSVGITIQSHIYHRNKFINSANWVTGGIYSTTSDISGYFGLQTENEHLVEENQYLRSLLFNKSINSVDSIVMDSTKILDHFEFRSASIFKNSYDKSKNYILINGGSEEGVAEDMGVISPKGIVGIIRNTSKNYAVVQSILNSYSQINASLKNSNHFGTLNWDGKDYKTVQLIDIPKQASIQKGDTIITGGMSAIFPKGILIGSIKDYKLDLTGNAYIIDISLFNDMSNLKNIYVIENKQQKEVENLEASIPNE